MWFIWLKMKQNEKIFSGHSDCFVLSCYDIWHFWIKFVNVLDLWGVWTCWISMVLAQVQQSQRHREEVHLLWTKSLLCSKSRESDQLCVCGTSQNVCIYLRTVKTPPPHPPKKTSIHWFSGTATFLMVWINWPNNWYIDFLLPSYTYLYLI